MGGENPSTGMPDPLGLRAEANHHPGKQKDLLVRCPKAKKQSAGRDSARYLALCSLFADNEMGLREVGDLYTETGGNQ